jgi:hypothetical protein
VTNLARATIHVLTTADCPHAAATLASVHAVLADVDLRANVTHVVVTDDAMARRLGFPGTPTVRVNGRDVDPTARAPTHGLACRLYADANGLHGVPPPALIRAALLGHASR